MNNQERQLRDSFDGLRFDDTPDPQHRDALERRLLDALATAHQRHGTRAPIWRIVMKSRITQLAAAAAVAIALLVPLSYATSTFVMRLIRGSYGSDEFTGQFQLDNNIYVGLRTGTRRQPTIVSADNIRFFIEDEEIRSTLRCRATAWPKHAWRTKVELLDAGGNRLYRTEHVSANAGIEMPQRRGEFDQDIHFSLGSANKASDVQRFKVCLEETPGEEATAPDAWVASNILPVVHGRVTDANGAPVAGAVVQIRQQRLPGQRSISAPNVLTDRQGCYSYDRIEWPYRVSAIVYEAVTSEEEYRHQYRGWNKVLEGTQKVDFAFGRFPIGSAILSGTVTDPNGAISREFTVDARLRIGWNDESAEYRYTYGHRVPFVSSDGRFKIRDLAAGTYDVFIVPTATRTVGIYTEPRRYVCELRAGQETTVGEQNAAKKTWYGRVLFDDGAPAVSESPLHTFTIVGAETWATVDSNGYFVALISDESMERLKSGQASLSVGLARRHSFLGVEQQGKVFPVELLSSQRDKAGTVTISRPQLYYGRILYEDGTPAVPPAAPWPGAQVWIRLRYTPATSADGGVTERLSDVDNEGYFTAHLTDELLERIRNGQVQMEVLHPSYENARESSPIGQYPSEMLARERGSARSCTLSFAAMPSGLRNLKQYLDSAYGMEELAAALQQYADDHGQDYPGALQQLAPYTTGLARLIEHIEYVPPSPAATALEPAETVLAYDRTLLETTGMTHVLFRDGHIDFCRPRQLRVLGISTSDETISP